MFPPESLTYITDGAWWISVSIKYKISLIHYHHLAIPTWLYLDNLPFVFQRKKNVVWSFILCNQPVWRWWLVGVSAGDPLEMSLWTFRPDDWVFRTPLWYGVLISNCFALSPIKRLSLAKNGELVVVTGDTATTNLLLLSVMIICSPNCSNCFLFHVPCSIPC